MKTKIIPILCILVATITQAGNLYDSELLKKQVVYYSPDTIKPFLEQKDYENAIFNAISFYPISSEVTIPTAIHIGNLIDEDLPTYIFKVFKKKLATDKSLRESDKNGSSINFDWMDQKAKWSDDFINEIICYQKITDEFKHSTLTAERFFWSAFDVYYSLDKIKASDMAKDINKDSDELKLLCLYAKTSNGRKLKLEDLEDFKFDDLEKPLKEMYVTLKGGYYMGLSDFNTAKKCYMEYFNLKYSLPVHIENLATCYLAGGDQNKAKRLYRYLVSIIQTNNISADGVYNLGCIFALEGNKDDALEYISQSIEMGVPKSFVKTDDTLQSLHQDKRFIKLVSDNIKN